MMSVICACGYDVSDMPYYGKCPKCGISSTTITLKTILTAANIELDNIKQYENICISCGLNFKKFDMFAEKIEHEQKKHPLFYCINLEIIPYNIQPIFDFYYPAIKNFINMNKRYKA